MNLLLRYVKLTAVLIAVCLAACPAALGQFDDEPEWEETPFQEALREGQTALEEREFEKAEREIRKALTLVADEPEEHRLYAEAYARTYLVRVLDAVNREDEALEVHELVMEALTPASTRLDDEDRADLHREHANLLMQLARWDDAEEHAELSFEHAQEWYGEDTPWSLSYQATMIQILMQTQRQEEAIEIHEQIIETYTETYGADHPGMIGALSSAAFDAVMADDSERSLEWQTQLLALDLNDKHETSQGLIYRHDWLAHEYKNLGEIDNAIDEFNIAINLLERAYGEDHLNIAGNHLQIANAHLTIGDYEASLESMNEAIEVIGDKDRNIALWIDAMTNKASVERLLGNDADADATIEALRKAIENN